MMGLSREDQQIVTGMPRSLKRANMRVMSSKAGYRRRFLVYVWRVRFAALTLSVKTKRDVGCGLRDFRRL